MKGYSYLLGAALLLLLLITTFAVGNEVDRSGWPVHPPQCTLPFLPEETTSF
jgi:hypothetical protein